MKRPDHVRRRSVLAGAAGVVLIGRAEASETTRLDDGLPAGARAIERFVNLPGKRRLIRLSERPPNYETPVDAFSDVTTQNDRFFVSYHIADAPAADDTDDWTLLISGDAIDKPMALKRRDLKDLPSSEVVAVCESAGNRRGLIEPHVPGLQWGDGAMGCATWHGPALRDVLKAGGVRDSALEVWFGSAGRPATAGLPPYEKSLPIDKALDPDTIVALEMNGAPLPPLNGFPIRLVVPGWVGGYWVKHLAAITVSSRPLANYWMRGTDRVPIGMFPVSQPFRSQLLADTEPATEMVVNSLISDPLLGHEADRSGFTIRGVAWDRGNGINRVEVSLDGGQSWQDALLGPSIGHYAYRMFSLVVGIRSPGPYRLVSRATSVSGEQQLRRLMPDAGGYFNNLPREIRMSVA